MLDIGSCPVNRRMAALTVHDPTIARMVWIDCSSQCLLMTEIALCRSTHKLSGRGASMTAFTGRDRVTAHEGKPRHRVFGNESGRFPHILAMAPLAFQSHG